MTVTVVYTTCAQGSIDSHQKSYGEDANYYIALRKKLEGSEKDAKQLFLRCAEKGSYYIARRSAEELTKIGDVQERLYACEKLLEKYNDEDALLIALREYEIAEDYSQIIVLTDKVDIVKCNSEIARIRLTSLAKRNSSNFEKEIYTVFTSRAITKSLRQLYNDTIDYLQNIQQKKIITFRINVYNSDYVNAYAMIPEIKAITATKDMPLTHQIISDMGKSCLYGSSDNTKNAQMFNEIASNENSNKNIIYNAWFYAARLYDRADANYSTISIRFIRAMNNAQTDLQYDNAFWYLLNSSLRTSLDNTIELLKTYSSNVNDPSYFDDFFELFSPLLLSQSRWSDFKKVYEIINGYMTEKSSSKFAYIYARLVQKDIINSQNKTEEYEQYFKKAISTGGELYYKILAATQLQLTEDETNKLLYEKETNTQFSKNEDIEKLLLGYAIFGLPEKIYSEWNEFTQNKNIKISLDCSIKLSQLLNKTATGNDDYFEKSLRIISRAASDNNIPLTEEALKLLYPRNYKKEVTAACKKFEIDEEIMYALIRSESFFNNSVTSSAGAQGLTQLMELTAGEIASRLKRTDYDLHDAQTNIEFGAYYLAYLMKRLDNSSLISFFAYNAGIGRVRRWLDNSRSEFGGKSAIDYDLFLETLPYSETREYGRKLITASANYGHLYYNKAVQDIVKNIINQ